MFGILWIFIGHQFWIWNWKENKEEFSFLILMRSITFFGRLMNPSCLSIQQQRAQQRQWIIRNLIRRSSVSSWHGATPGQACIWVSSSHVHDMKQINRKSYVLVFFVLPFSLLAACFKSSCLPNKCFIMIIWRSLRNFNRHSSHIDQACECVT